MTASDKHADRASVIGRLPIVHLGYVVEDIPKAVAMWTRSVGAGPFLMFEHVQCDIVEHEGGPGVFDHSAAFGQWGSIAVELQQIHKLDPLAMLAPRLMEPSNRLTHVAYVAPNPEQESARLERVGAPKFLHLTTGPVEVTYHDAPWLGHAIEIHRDSDFLRGFIADIAQAAVGWDGTNPLRTQSASRSGVPEDRYRGLQMQTSDWLRPRLRDRRAPR